ncbi:MAG: hypothetical protein Q9163_004249 [Psora crenata]
MSPKNKYSLEEVLNLTVKDAQDPDFVNIEIKGWQKLTPEEKERCILKLRELKNQRDELAQSSAVDANILTDKLNHIERSRSATPYDPYDPNEPEQIAEEQKKEKESHEALIKDNGRPCYPIELGFDVFENPGQYKDILEYWQWGRGSEYKRLIFLAQLRRWEWFRRRQQYHRRYYVRRNRFHEFPEILRERRRKYGLDGDLQLHEDVAKQSKLDEWMEYQDYELLEYEHLQRSLKESQEELASYRKALAEEGFSAFEEIEGLEFGKYYSITLDWSSKEAKAKEKEELAERKLRIAKKRLEAAHSEELGEKVERVSWIGWFVKEVESQRTRVDELQRSADEARRDLEPCQQWLDARRSEWDARHSESFQWSDEGQRLFELEVETAEYRTRFDKRKELQTRAHQASLAYYCAGEEEELAKELLEAARTEDLAQIVERAALIRRTQKEVRFAEFHLEEEKESTKVLDLKRLVIDELRSITSLKEKIKRHDALLDWVERQRRELVGDGASTGQKSGSRRSTRVSSRALPSPRVTEASGVDRLAKKIARPQRPSTAKSILDPVDPAKVTKTPKQKWKGRRRTNVPRDISRATEKTNVGSNTTEPGSYVALPVKDGIRARLRPVHSSRVSKPAPKKPIGRQRDATRLSPTRYRHRGTGKDALDMPTSSKKVFDPSINTSTQRSTRGSKRSQSRRLSSR